MAEPFHRTPDLTLSEAGSLQHPEVLYVPDAVLLLVLLYTAFHRYVSPAPVLSILSHLCKYNWTEQLTQLFFQTHSLISIFYPFNFIIIK